MIRKKSIAGALEKIYEETENCVALQSIRDGLVMIIPVLMIGSFSILFRSLPIPVYQDFISNFGGGFLADIFVFLYGATVGFLAVYLTISISVSYTGKRLPDKSFSYGSLFASLISFCICAGMFQEGFSIGVLGAQGLFTAIVCALSASALYCSLIKAMTGSLRLYTDGADGEFNRSLAMLFPIVIISLLFAVFNLILVKFFHVTGFNMLFSNVLTHIFSGMGRSLGTTVLYLCLTNVMWMFGIHGDNVLESVTVNIFMPGIEINRQLLEAGAQPTEIYSQTFYDVFALMGGSGGTLSLLLAILLFGRRRGNRRLAKYSALPMIFNINEIMMFGLPVVFNPIMMIPFLATPVVQILIAGLAVQLHLVPVVTQQVPWTTPIILSGYLATGSAAGAVLQIINVLAGVMIYCPFIKIYEYEKNKDSSKKMDQLLHILRKSEVEDKPVELLTLRNYSGEVAKEIAEELRFKIGGQLPRLFYQPQFDRKGNCVGAEALLRWETQSYGTVYPPLIVRLAEEAGVLEELEEGVFRAVVRDMESLVDVIGKEAKISINVTGTTIQSERFELFLRELRDRYPHYSTRICVEITEQAALNFDDELTQRLTRIKEMGYSLAIDDFSMGSTSIKYLQTNIFDMVKLDGGLSRDILTNSRSRDIIASITELSHNFGIRVLAEYVETEEQKRVLEETGCLLYQGYLYSPAVPVEQFQEICGARKVK